MTQTYELVEWTLDGKTVCVPHDAMLGERRSADAPTGNAGAYFHGGVYRYTREITAPQNLDRKRVLLEFEGVMGRASVYVDGKRLASHAYGYTGFAVDVSRALEAGMTSTVEVVADNSAQPNSRWYAGSGLYRPVRLVVQDENRITRGGIAITTECTNPARIRVQTTVEGQGTPYVRIERDGRAVAGRSGSDVRLGIPGARLCEWTNGPMVPGRPFTVTYRMRDDGRPALSRVRFLLVGTAWVARRGDRKLDVSEDEVVKRPVHLPVRPEDLLRGSFELTIPASDPPPGTDEPTWTLRVRASVRGGLPVSDDYPLRPIAARERRPEQGGYNRAGIPGEADCHLRRFG